MTPDEEIDRPIDELRAGTSAPAREASDRLEVLDEKGGIHLLPVAGAPRRLPHPSDRPGVVNARP